MIYTNIVEAWEEFRETLQSSKYMQRLTLKEDEKLFMQGYMRGFDMAKQESPARINRLEVIDHTVDGEGRAYIKRGDLEVEVQLQDDDKTMKIFIKCGKY